MLLKFKHQHGTNHYDTEIAIDLNWNLKDVKCKPKSIQHKNMRMMRSAAVENNNNDNNSK